jgi:alpha/beta superfamily hydrolase
VIAVDVNSPHNAWAAAVLLHPHPDRGGDRFNAVVDSLYRALPGAGVASARFDFSSSDTGSAARQTVEVIEVIPTRPLVVVGYSFGAAVATMVNDDRVAGWFLIAPPLRLVSADQSTIGSDPRPKALAVPEFDQYTPPAEAAKLTEGWINTALNPLPGADHFLAGALNAVVDMVLAWIRSPEVSQDSARHPPLSE